jgi:hypothetical protein
MVNISEAALQICLEYFWPPIPKGYEIIARFGIGSKALTSGILANWLHSNTLTQPLLRHSGLAALGEEIY